MIVARQTALLTRKKGSKIAVAMVLGLWRLYKVLLSPLFGSSCRFYPTCSHYACLLLTHENPLHAMMKIAYRLMRCQPFAQGGIEYPIIKKRFIAHSIGVTKGIDLESTHAQDFKIAYRLMRCQPFAQGGIEYPIIKKRFIAHSIGVTKGIDLESTHAQDFVYWYVPIHTHKSAQDATCYAIIPALRSK